jgi:hypothetical protein
MTLRGVLAFSGAVAVALDTGCFVYVPAVADPTPGAEVRVQLTPEGTTELARYLGPRVITVDGRLSSVAGDGAMMIAPTLLQIADGARQQWTAEDVVTFPRVYVTSVQERTVNRRKSTIAAVAVAASLVALGTIVMRGIGSNSPPTGTGPGTGVFVRHSHSSP